MIVIVMGVSGCGKSSVGRAIAAQTGWSFIEGDDLHPPANRKKMAAGIPLDDNDRWPWLDAIAIQARLIDQAGGSVVIACSALKQSYRERLLHAGGTVRFVHLSGSRDIILARMQSRSSHFMPPSLLDSQLATLEPPSIQEPAQTFDVTLTIAEISSSICKNLQT